MDKKMMAIVAKMCAYQSASCRGLDMADMARQLLDMANVPETAVISEIPVSDSNQVVFYFYIPGDSNYYMLFAGDGIDGSKANFELSIDGTLDNDGYVDFFEDAKQIDINYFKEGTNMTNKWVKNFCNEADNLVYMAECGKFDLNKVFDALGRMRTAYMAIIDALKISEEERHTLIRQIRDCTATARGSLEDIVCK